MTENITIQPAQPRIAAKNPNKQLKFVVAVILLLLLSVVLVAWTIKGNSSYYMTVDQVLAKADSLEGQKIRMSGAVAQDTANWDAENLLLNFALTDASGEQVTVSFHGSRPSNFSRATEAIVEGEMMPDGTFRADNLLLKCPSRYEEAPEVTEFTAIQ
ncbi:MAG: cytochrome c maturation protein CcmE [Caldilineales bacterium]|nr:cytochrome c maturation protein CcmE [Caldilineales bacterium]MCW5857646.1 cytochrome c maturation protein CcmE [Caldilineales bacterium]